MFWWNLDHWRDATLKHGKRRWAIAWTWVNPDCNWDDISWVKSTSNFLIQYKDCTRLLPVSLKNWGEEREAGNIHMESCWLLAPGSGATNQIEEENHVYTTICLYYLKKWTCKYWLHLKGWWKTIFICAEGARSKCLRTKSTVVDLWASEYRHPQKSIPDASL